MLCRNLGSSGLALHVATACAFVAARPGPASANDVDQSTSNASRAGERRKSSCGFSIAWHKTVAPDRHATDSSLEQTKSLGDLDWAERAPGLCEVTIGATGLRQGAKLVDGSGGAGPVMQSMQSSLCKRQMLHNLAETLQIKISRPSEPCGTGYTRDCANMSLDTVFAQAKSLTSPEHESCSMDAGIMWMQAYKGVKQCAKPYQNAVMSFRAATPFRGWLHSHADAEALRVDSAGECCK